MNSHSLFVHKKQSVVFNYRTLFVSISLFCFIVWTTTCVVLFHLKGDWLVFRLIKVLVVGIIFSKPWNTRCNLAWIFFCTEIRLINARSRNIARRVNLLLPKKIYCTKLMTVDLYRFYLFDKYTECRKSKPNASNEPGKQMPKAKLTIFTHQTAE